jgi:phosphate transport system ATP-binding protein
MNAFEAGAEALTGARPATAAAEATYPPIRVQDLAISYGRKRVVHDVNFDVSKNTIQAMIGPSGCGKTTILRSLNRLSDLSGARIEGKILLYGDDTQSGSMDTNELRRRVGMVFQQPNPFPMSIFENVAYPIREQSAKRLKRHDLEGAVEKTLTQAGLWDEVKDDLERSALGLSGGQKQRLCIARTLAAQPEVILMDEPCSALDPRSTALIEELMLKLKDEVTMVVVTHNMGQAQRVGDRVVFMLNGELVEQGTADHMFNHAERQETRDYVAGVFG